ncbi:MAG: DUF1508 domain-containing protein [Holophagales bacterium]|nr:DUF1508 domain-containing protein [Holophagales bacterium]MXW02339.1 DUF1508 domain-containing protein [Holophagales bacterium]MYC09737.1 DUF1508 domain-containing protein [Holophagales bacterium]
MSLSGMRLYYYFRGKRQRWFWILVGGNGKIMARSRQEGYTTEVACLAAIRNVRSNASSARVLMGTSRMDGT